MKKQLRVKAIRLFYSHLFREATVSGLIAGNSFAESSYSFKTITFTVPTNPGGGFEIWV